MARPRKSDRTLLEALHHLRDEGIRPPTDLPTDEAPVENLQERIRHMLDIIRAKPLKATDMHFLILYDISDDRVRGHVARYLQRQGCIRIQRSVFLARSEGAVFKDIVDTLREINSYYDNEDSIILAPVNASDVRSMKLIGKNIQLDTLIDPPNTLFF